MTVSDGRSLQPLLITRFLINLKKVDTDTGSAPSQGGSRAQVSHVRFRASPVDSIVSDMGAPMDYGDGVPVDDEDSGVDLPWKLEGGEFGGA